MDIWTNGSMIATTLTAVERCVDSSCLTQLDSLVRGFCTNDLVERVRAECAGVVQLFSDIDQQNVVDNNGLVHVTSCVPPFFECDSGFVAFEDSVTVSRAVDIICRQLGYGSGNAIPFGDDSNVL